MQKIMEEKDDAVKQSANKDIKIKSLMKTNLELQSQLASLNQLVAVKDDLADQLNQVNDYVDELCAQKVSMQKELDTAGDYLLDQEEKTDKANKTAVELLNQLKEADSEIESLKAYIVMLKS